MPTRNWLDAIDDDMQWPNKRDRPLRDAVRQLDVEGQFPPWRARENEDATYPSASSLSASGYNLSFRNCVPILQCFLEMAWAANVMITTHHSTFSKTWAAYDDHGTDSDVGIMIGTSCRGRVWQSAYVSLSHMNISTLLLIIFSRSSIFSALTK
jgi:hypothetical protein